MYASISEANYSAILRSLRAIAWPREMEVADLLDFYWDHESFLTHNVYSAVDDIFIEFFGPEFGWPEVQAVQEYASDEEPY